MFEAQLIGLSREGIVEKHLELLARQVPKAVVVGDVVRGALERLGRALHALSIAVTAPPRADLIYSPGMLRFVGGDEAAAVRLANALLETSSLLSQAKCEGKGTDPTTLRPLLDLAERYVLYIVLFSLAYEFDFGASTRVDQGPSQTLAILSALDERLETSAILFPKLELLTPEDAALLVDSHSADELSMFPTYVELLYSMSTTNADLADKKARIAAKITALREAVTVFLRGERAEPSALCTAISTLDSATSDALLWAVADVQHGGADRRVVAAAYDIDVSVAVTNTAPDATVMLRPRAQVQVERDDGSVAEVSVTDERLDAEALLDNNVPPGFTQVRTYGGLAQHAIVRGCELVLSLVIDGEDHELAVPINLCGPQGDDATDSIESML